MRCSTGTTCVAGTCEVPRGLCNPGNPNGLCASRDLACVQGVCYPVDNRPADCAVGVNGRCPDDLACADGTCTAISTDTECSADQQEGLCLGGQACVRGVCFDELSNLCSGNNSNGYCPDRQVCDLGSCADNSPTCSADNFVGSCDAWEVCVQGECTAPSPTTLCSVENPEGVCPAAEVCVAATCTPLQKTDVNTNTCSAALPFGLCPAGAGCVEGSCVAITANNVCSGAQPTGICSGGQRCASGECLSVSCEAGGFACTPGSWCSVSICLPLPCSTTTPEGMCLDSTTVCEKGQCVDPSCGDGAVPGEGRCPTGFYCDAVSDACAPEPCSLTFPDGVCPITQTCVAGVCEEEACAPTNLDGTCAENAITCHPNYGCGYTDATCCDDTLEAAVGCSLGSCTAALCSTININGGCPGGEYCDGGSCKVAPCSPFYLNGTCDTGETCYRGSCAKEGCTSAADPSVFCGARVCNQALDLCLLAPCSASVPDGFCAAGTACCNPDLVTDMGCALGTCVLPPCKPEFPGGSCPQGEICSGGACVRPPCSSTYPEGNCGPNFICCNDSLATQDGCTVGECVVADCDVLNPLGACDVPADRCAPNGTCQPFVCSPEFNDAPCPVGELCSTDACVDAPCTAQYPGGKCSGAEVCAGGTCLPQPCSTLYPSGACGGDAFICNAGVCVAAQCSVDVPNGTCDDIDPSFVCNGATCVPYACGVDFPDGPCPSFGDTCTQTSPGVYACVAPPCSTEFLGGSCPTGLVCTTNGCIKPGCSPAVLDGACSASQVCCDQTQITAGLCSAGEQGSCVRAACDIANPKGSCLGPDLGKVCLNGNCVDPNCSVDFPNGDCPNGEICIATVCTTICNTSKAARVGWCAEGSNCVDGQCAGPCASDIDCDGISDSAEDRNTCAAGTGTTSSTCTALASSCAWSVATSICFYDTDDDGSPDAFDRDSDADGIPDAFEAGDNVLASAPFDTDIDGTPDFRDLDSDADGISDGYEAGGAPAVPRDTDGDGVRDFRDDDSDDDGIFDRCEAADGNSGSCSALPLVDMDLGLCASRGLADCAANHNCKWDGVATCKFLGVYDSDGDGLEDYRDLDSDNDGILDRVERRDTPANAADVNTAGADHDGDGLPDFRDTDSDNDTVLDVDEDVNGDGIVNCQTDGSGTVVDDPRPSPACTDVGYDYNPGCPGAKCLLAETSRVHAETDRDDIGDGVDGIVLVCSTANLKPIDVYYARAADYAFTLEQDFNALSTLTRAGVGVGMTFGDGNTLAGNGSLAVAGFIVQRTPDATAMAASDTDPARSLIKKALAQESVDRALMGAVSGVQAVALVLNRSFTSFDGYGVVAARYRITTTSAVDTWQLRDNLLAGLDPSIAGISGANSANTYTEFTLLTQTLYRYDNGSAGAVLLITALVPTGTGRNDAATFSYRTLCNQQDLSSCGTREGCVWNGGSASCDNDSTYQLPLFFADNIAGGSAIAQFGDDLSALCQSFVQENSILDFVWVIDNSASMNTEIDQVRSSATLFIDMMNNSEADYRLGQVSSTRDLRAVSNDNSSGDWEPNLPFDELEPSCTGLAPKTSCEGVNGCYWTGGFCQEPGCAAATTAAECTATTGCAWTGTACGPVDCSLVVCPDCSVYSGNQAACNGDASCQWDAATSICRTDVCTNCDNTSGCQYNFPPGSCEPVGCGARINETQCNSGNEGCGWFEGICLNPPRNGALAGGFTGAIAGRTTGMPNDRVATFDCTDYPRNCQTLACGDTPNSCCPACEQNPGAVIESPACYFASRLPCTELPEAGYEFSLLMGQWATYRAGGMPTCVAAKNDIDCAALPGCAWDGTLCVAAYCSLPASVGTDLLQRQEECDGNDPGALPGETQYPDVPSLSDTAENELEPAGCAWNAVESACVSSIGGSCANYVGEANCMAQSPRCIWDTMQFICLPNALSNTVLCSANDALTCTSQGGGYCEWQTDNTLPAGGYCRPPEAQALRQNAERVAVVLTDEEACYIKDHDYDGGCQFNNALGYGYNIADYGTLIRETRTESFRGFYESRGFSVFAITGDKANTQLSPGPNNGGCSRTGTCGAYISRTTCQADTLCVWNPPNAYAPVDCATAFSVGSCGFRPGCTWDASCSGNIDENSCTTAGCVWGLNNGGNAYECRNCKGDGTVDGQCYANIAEAGNAVIEVAEGTDGGWGSICAADLFPTIEEIVVASLAKASPYRLEAAIGTEATQPIASTLKVAVEVCDNLIEYPSCRADDGGSGTHMLVAPRSRDNGFDYDSLRNVVLLYGNARPAKDGDVVVSYRHWLDLTPNANPAGNCPCPQTNGASCACPSGQSCDTTAGVCTPDPTCGGGCLGTNEVCDPSLGLCVCDPTCADSCGAGETCDNNGRCMGLNESTCVGLSDCNWLADIGACFSTTCGECACDTGCGGGCPLGQTCDSNTASVTCGQCACDQTCGGSCPTGLSCNTDVGSSTCGSCEPPRCGNCDVGFECDAMSGFCICDTGCGNGCSLGQTCDDDPASLTCGQCACDTTCSGGCVGGQLCDTDDITPSATCGLCQVDPTCGGSCLVDCSGGTDTSSCTGIAGCRWTEWNGGACQPVRWQECVAASGLCTIDPTCDNACGPTESCDALTGECVCDTQCGYACAPGLTCDGDAASATCGLCLCDTTCGGVSCAAGLVCDDNTACSSATDVATCGGIGGCSWDPATSLCLSVSCGRCVVDPTCGGCPTDQVCNPTTGLCEPQCPECAPSTTCDLTTGQCVCDQTCGGACPSGQQCDSDKASTSCGSCLCDTTCGGACASGQACDTDNNSATCGLCLVDPTCGGQCAADEICDVITGLCVEDPNCGLGCPEDYVCDPILRRCVNAGG